MSMTVQNSSQISVAQAGEIFRSPQLAFAMLQMELAKANKEQALQGIKEIQDAQAQKKEMSDILNQAREYQGKNATQNADDTTHTSSEFDKKIKDLGFSIPNETDKDKNTKEWDKLIAQLQTKMDTIGADIQTKMVVLQDMMGQYNAYMQGANSSIASSNQTLSSLARGN